MAETSQASRYHAALKGVIKRAIIGLDALGDSEMRFQSQGQVWNRAINDDALACGYPEATVRFIPTAREITQAEIVADCLLWLGAGELLPFRRSGLAERNCEQASAEQE